MLGFGGAEIGYENARNEDVARIVSAAMDAGVNVFDTGECYQDSEEKLGLALRGHRSQVFVLTKCGHASGLEGEDWSPRVLAESIDRSLIRLRTDYVDLMQLHSCSSDVLRKGEAIEVLQRARQAGKTKFIGYSGDGDDALFAVSTGAFDTLQTSVSVLDQQAITMTVPAAADRAMGVIAKRPIANAVWRFTNKPESSYYHEYWDRLRKLDYEFMRDGDIARSVATALRFTLSVPEVHVAIVGTKSPARWAQNSTMLNDGPLPAEYYSAIRNRWMAAAPSSWVGQV